jgi:hypothetical protein
MSGHMRKVWAKEEVLWGSSVYIGVCRCSNLLLTIKSWLATVLAVVSCSDRVGEVGPAQVGIVG